MKSFIGSHYIEKNYLGSSEKYTAYQIIDYVGRDHILIEEEGWAIMNMEFACPDKRFVMHSDSNSTQKTSIITIRKFIKDHQDDVIFHYFTKNETEKKLADLTNYSCRCLKNTDYEQWINALTREICEEQNS